MTDAKIERLENALRVVERTLAGLLASECWRDGVSGAWSRQRPDWTEVVGPAVNTALTAARDALPPPRPVSWYCGVCDDPTCACNQCLRCDGCGCDVHERDVQEHLRRELC